MRYPSSKRLGFTLMEVLVAVVILGLVGVTLVQTTQTTTSQSRYLADKVIATWVASDRATAMRLAMRTGATVSLDKEKVEQGNRSWRTSVRVIKQTGLLDRVEVDVVLPERSDTSIYTLTTFLPHTEADE